MAFGPKSLVIYVYVSLSLFLWCIYLLCCNTTNRYNLYTKTFSKDSCLLWFYLDYKNAFLPAKSCGHPGESLNADFELVSGTDFQFTSVVEYTCHQGYQPFIFIHENHFFYCSPCLTSKQNIGCNLINQKINVTISMSLLCSLCFFLVT